MAGEMLEESFLVEEDGCVGLVNGVLLLNAEDAGVLNVVGTFDRDVALLQKADAEVDAIASEVALVWRLVST